MDKKVWLIVSILFVGGCGAIEAPQQFNQEQFYRTIDTFEGEYPLLKIFDCNNYEYNTSAIIISFVNDSSLKLYNSTMESGVTTVPYSHFLYHFFVCNQYPQEGGGFGNCSRYRPKGQNIDNEYGEAELNCEVYFLDLNDLLEG